MLFNEESDGNEATISQAKVTNFIRMASFVSFNLYGKLSPSDQHRLVLGIVAAIDKLIGGV